MIWRNTYVSRTVGFGSMNSVSSITVDKYITKYVLLENGVLKS